MESIRDDDDDDDGIERFAMELIGDSKSQCEDSVAGCRNGDDGGDSQRCLKKMEL